MAHGISWCCVGAAETVSLLTECRSTHASAYTPSPVPQDYMAPEVLRCPPKNLPQENKNNAALHYNNSVDAWAVGVFAYELIVGFPPFAGEAKTTGA